MKGSIWTKGTVAARWLGLAGILLGLFLLYSYLVVRGEFTVLTLQQEQWLLQRPLTRFDCVVEEWKNLGEAPASLVLMLGLCVVCWLLGYRRRVALALLLLLGIGVGCEYLGKQVVQQPVTVSIGQGMPALSCPQISRQPRVTQLEVFFGMWWVAPAARSGAIRREHLGATTPIFGDDGIYNFGYPSGHALRWMLLGLVACWLAWRHARHRWLRWLLMLLTTLLAFGGGLGIYFVGGHLFTDIIGGYLLGACLACCAIACLQAHETKGLRTVALQEPLLPVQLANRSEQ
jgi:membrane-associated phospholipid phosphatase